jgi:hypothetical protein
MLLSFILEILYLGKKGKGKKKKGKERKHPKVILPQTLCVSAC